MNKDVIYIEPEQDITDILAEIKAAKHKIIALVPPKKASVLRSAVNFKLIDKTARKNEKTVVLITADQSLRRLAASVKMPVAKTLQSKPQLPEDPDAEEFGEDDKNSDVIEAKDEEKTPAKKVPVATAVKVAKKKPEAPVAKDEEVIEGKAAPKEDDEPKTKSEKKVAKMKGTKIPNFAKYRKFIIAGAIALVIIIGFSIWATAIAPRVKIDVTVKATSSNFNEKVTFTSDESKADPKTGVLFIEQKSVTKKYEGEFKATGKVDKGTKATGTITVVRPKGEEVSTQNKNYSIPKDATVTINGKVFVVTEGGSANITKDDQYHCDANLEGKTCKTVADISSGAIKVVAKDVGEDYNVAAANSNISASFTIPKSYKVASSAMTGGSSKMVTIVSKEDVETATSDLSGSGDSEAREELASQFGTNYILLGNMTQSDPKITTSPALNEEVGDNITPKIVKEVTYTMFAVERESVSTYITAVTKANLGDDTQIIYDTGIDNAFFEAFKNTAEDNSAKLKSTVKTGPSVTEEMVKEKSLGKKTGEVQTQLKSINGVSNVKITPNFFWVSRVPDDINKVEINISFEE